MDYLLPDKVYLALKWFGLLFLPALSWLVSYIGSKLGYDVSNIADIIYACGTFVGIIIGASELKAIKSAKVE